MIELRRPLSAALLGLLLAAPAAAQDVVADARAQAGFLAGPVLPDPAWQLDWKSPDKTFWISGETPRPERDAGGRVSTASGTGSLGARYEILQQGPLSLTATPTLRAEGRWAEEGQPHHALGGAVFEELTLALPDGFRLRAKGGLGDPTGLSAGGGGALPGGLAFRGEAAISGGLAPLGAAGTRFDLQVSSLHPVAGLSESGFSSRCEMKLELSRKGVAPLGIGTSCPGARGEGWFTLHVGGRF